ncbi:erythromycin esterase family protein [Plantactinospora solaniradicis]|uniref:Erythromycin esterase family protein n=1 Tax=Plantactinospora solaniradicis TaxID=1723736 RepID=A0ABW1JYR4_9ACTN
MTGHPSIHDAGWALAADNRDGGDGGLGTAPTEFLRSLATRPRLLGLGEPTHGEEAFPELRNQLFRHLVQHEGYRSIAIESDCLAGLLVDGFVADGVGSLDGVIRHGFSHGFGNSEASRELVEWMRCYNRDRPAVDRLRFFGFDAPIELASAASPQAALIALHGYLASHVDTDLIPCTADAIIELTGDDERWTNPEAAMDPTRSVGSSTDVTELRLVTDDLLALLVSQSPHLIARTSYEEWWRARLHGRTGAGLLRYHAGMAENSPARVARLLGVRDAMMADNLNAIMENQARRGPTLVFAHNSHLRKDPSRWELPPGWGALAGRTLQWWSAGAIVHAQVGDQYAFLASALGVARHQGLDVPPADTLEGVLAALPEDRYVMNSARLADALRGAEVSVTTRTDTSTNHGYFPLDPDHLEDTDGVIFIKEITEARA